MPSDSDTRPRFTFAHQRLDVHRVAIDLAVVARRLAARLPRNDRKIADQLHRAATGIPLLIAEGANRRHPREKRQKYNEALGECGETASAIELIAASKLASANDCDHALRLTQRAAAMLCALIKYESKRADQQR